MIAMGLKDPVLGYVCTNANGSNKLPLASIRKAKNPRGFRIEKTAVPYFSPLNMGSNKCTFCKWFLDVFLLHIPRCTSKHVVMIIDNCQPQRTDLQDARAPVEILNLLPNYTSLQQPMNTTINSTWKEM